jgi:hypothetical protein
VIKHIVYSFYHFWGKKKTPAVRDWGSLLSVTEGGSLTLTHSHRPIDCISLTLMLEEPVTDTVPEEIRTPAVTSVTLRPAGHPMLPQVTHFLPEHIAENLSLGAGPVGRKVGPNPLQSAVRVSYGPAEVHAVRGSQLSGTG